MNISDFRNRTFFCNTAMLSNPKLMKAVATVNCTLNEIKLLAEDPTMLNFRNIAGDTPLHYAISYGHSLKNVIELLKHGALLDSVHFKRTPLHAAASRKGPLQYAMLKVLLEYGAIINKRDFLGRTPLFILLDTDNNYQERSLKLLLSNGADVNALNGENTGILKIALKNPTMTLNGVKMLLEYGANAKHCKGYYMNRPFAKLIFQYILIKRIANNRNSCLPKEIVKFYDLCCYQKLLKYWNECVAELIAMKEERLSENYSLFQYINERCSSATLNENDLNTSLTAEVLSKFEQYPYCKDLIIASLKEKCLLNELYHTNIYAWKDNSINNCKVSLNGDTIQALATYLSRNDMINLILTYRNVKQERINFESPKSSAKRNHCELNASEQPSKYFKA